MRDSHIFVSDEGLTCPCSWHRMRMRTSPWSSTSRRSATALSSASGYAIGALFISQRINISGQTRHISTDTSGQIMHVTAALCSHDSVAAQSACACCCTNSGLLARRGVFLLLAQGRYEQHANQLMSDWKTERRQLEAPAA